MGEGTTAMRTWSISLSLVALAILVLASPALAGRRWCASDPIVALNGHDAQLWVAIPEEYQSLVTGPIDIQISTPKGVTTETLFLDAGFNGYGEKVKFSTLTKGKLYADGSFDVQVRVQVPINTKNMAKIPLQLTVSAGGQADQITADSWEYTGGVTYVVEMTNAGTTLTARFPATTP
jgi:hypothetical protein